VTGGIELDGPSPDLVERVERCLLRLDLVPKDEAGEEVDDRAGEIVEAGEALYVANGDPFDQRLPLRVIPGADGWIEDWHGRLVFSWDDSPSARPGGGPNVVRVPDAFAADLPVFCRG